MMLSSVKLLKRLFEKDNDEVIYKDKLHSLYAQYDIYSAIWDGLSDDDIIKKMLILNAGQRSVSSVHQFELLFLHFFDDNKLTLDRNIHLYREKQKETAKNIDIADERPVAENKQSYLDAKKTASDIRKNKSKIERCEAEIERLEGEKSRLEKEAEGDASGDYVRLSEIYARAEEIDKLLDSLYDEIDAAEKALAVLGGSNGQ